VNAARHEGDRAGGRGAGTVVTGWRERMRRYRTDEGAAAYRDKHAGTLLRRLADRREKTLLVRLLRRIGPLESVLDCPCGAGRFLPLLAGEADRVFALDQSRALLLLARAGRAAVGDAGALPLRDGAVDAVVCLRLLHHFPEAADRRRILAEAARVARKGVVVSFADADTWKGRRMRSRRRPVPRRVLAEDAAAAGLALDPGVLKVNSLFSGFSFALLRTSGN